MNKRIFASIKILLALQSLCNTVIAQHVDKSRDSILYLSQFDNIEEAPAINHGDTAICKVEKGNFIMDIKRANRYWALHFGSAAMTHDPEILEIKLKMEADSLPGIYGLSFNAVLGDNNIWNDYLFLLSTDKKYCIYIKKSNGDHIEISGWQPSFDVNSTGYNLVRIEKRAENLFRFYINNEAVFQTKLQPIPLMFGGLYTDPHSILYVDFLKLGVFKK